MTVAIITIDEADAEWPEIRLPLQMDQTTVHVIRVPLSLAADQIAKNLQLLDDDERRRADRIRIDEPRHRFICCRAVLRQLLGSCCGVSPTQIRFTYGPHGKPALDREKLSSHIPFLEFSVSHSGEIGLIAIGLGVAIGIDVEEMNPRVNAMNLADRFFNSVETRELRSLSPDKQLRGFYHGWTCKEAYLKATGKGFSLPLNSFCVSMDPDQPSSLRWVEGQPAEPLGWRLRTLHVSDCHAAAVIVAARVTVFECWDWDGRIGGKNV